MKKRFFIFVGLVFCVVFGTPAFGAIATWQDNRREISDEEWASSSFNKFVHLFISTLDQRYFECTAQYVAPNIILSAGHCVENGASYSIDRADAKMIPVKLINYGYEEDSRHATIKDWALFLIEDERYYRNDIFDVSVPNYEKNDIAVKNAGWGRIRILTQQDLQKIRLDAATNPNFRKLWDTNYAKSYKDNKLKVSDCSILGKKQNKDVYGGKIEAVVDGQAYQVLYSLDNNKFPVNCIVAGGNSGGGVVTENGELYGIISYGYALGLSWLFDRRTVATAASSKQFIAAVDQAKKDYPPKTNEPEAPKKPVVNDTKIDGQPNVSGVSDKVGEKKDAPKEPEVPAEADWQKETEKTVPDIKSAEAIIKKVEQEKDRVCDKAEKNFEKVKNMSDAELAQFIDDAVYCKDREETLSKLQKAYEEAKAKEQSFANRSLTALSVAATGIGGMQALQGLAEQSADEDAAADMAAYIETMRCTYADGKQVKAGPEEIELPGANNQELMNLRAEYLSLAQDLKERKNALGIKAGIESEVIIDRTETGLYDEENVGIAGGNYASVYRAQALKSETDQAKIDDEKDTAANRVKYGAIAAGAGTVVGVTGDSLVNGQLGDLMKGNDSATENK